MEDREKVIKTYDDFVNGYECFCTSDDYEYEMHKAVLALLKESVSQGVVDQIRWERDTALSQLKEIGKGLGSKMDDIVTMLKEQEAVEPTLIREGRNKHYNDYVCPRCDNEVVYEQNYCSECGVQFLWEDR